MNVSIPGSNDISFQDGELVPGGAIAVGAELKIQRNLALSPFARVVFFPDLSWPGLLEAAEAASLDPLEERATLNGLQVGLRIGFR